MGERKKESEFNRCCWENWTCTWRRIKSDPLLHTYTKSTKMDKRLKCSTMNYKNTQRKQRGEAPEH
jgi:hypothetical protein